MNTGPAALKAVIFDFDGVLVDSEPLHWQAFCEVLKPLGLAHSYDVYVERYIGFDDRDAIRAIFRDAGRLLDNDRFDQLVRAKEAAFWKIVEKGVVPFPGAKELVDELLQAGLPLAIASGAKGNEIRRILDSCGMHPAFPIIVSADDVAAGKPHPETYQRAVAGLVSRYPALRSDSGSDGASPQGIVVIEDTPTGIQAPAAPALWSWPSGIRIPSPSCTRRTGRCRASRISAWRGFVRPFSCTTRSRVSGWTPVDKKGARHAPRPLFGNCSENRGLPEPPYGPSGRCGSHPPKHGPLLFCRNGSGRLAPHPGLRASRLRRAPGRASRRRAVASAAHSSPGKPEASADAGRGGPGALIAPHPGHGIGRPSDQHLLFL